MKYFKGKNISKQLGSHKVNTGLLAFLLHLNYTAPHGSLVLEEISVMYPLSDKIISK